MTTTNPKMMKPINPYAPPLAAIGGIIAAIAIIGSVCGCNTATPASRANTGRYDSVVTLRDCTNCTVSVTQQILSSADGQGDQTANPVQTNDIKPDTTSRYTCNRISGCKAWPENYIHNSFV